MRPARCSLPVSCANTDSTVVPTQERAHGPFSGASVSTAHAKLEPGQHKMPVEAAIVSAFILPERRARYLGLLETKRGRIKFREQLAHFRDLDPRFATAIPPGQQTARAIGAILRQHGAPGTCTIISESQELDNVVMELSAALSKVVGYGAGCIVSCLEGHLAYYEGEEPGCRFILRRNAGQRQGQPNRSS